MIEDTVLVVVRIGTAVLVLEAVRFFLPPRTLVHGIANAVIVVVPIGTSVAVFEAVAIFGQLWALVGFVGHAVVIHVVLARDPLQRSHHLKRRSPERIAQRSFGPQRKRHLAQRIARRKPGNSADCAVERPRSFTAEDAGNIAEPCTSATQVQRPWSSHPKACGLTDSAAPHGTS